MTVIEQLFLYHLLMRRNSEGQRAAPPTGAPSVAIPGRLVAVTDCNRDRSSPGAQSLIVKRANAGEITPAI